MKQGSKKTVALLLSALMLMLCLSGCGSRSAEQAAPAQIAQEADPVTEAAMQLLGGHSNTAGREETVYVIADANGRPDETIVSVWLKNPEGAETLSDHSRLQGIRNVKGDESFTAGEDGALTWQAMGSDIHYQGTTDRELPVSTAIRYELDGKEIRPEDLAGASGHLSVTFSYTNHTGTQREVNGRTVTLYQPFLVVSGLMLDDDRAANITVTNGKIIQTGDRSVVVGMAMPGLRESLGLDEMHVRDGEPLQIEIPETVVIEADVRDFQLLTSVTVVENSFLQDLGSEQRLHKAGGRQRGPLRGRGPAQRRHRPAEHGHRPAERRRGAAFRRGRQPGPGGQTGRRRRQDPVRRRGRPLPGQRGGAGRRRAAAERRLRPVRRGAAGQPGRQGPL